jgi:plasmid maintenance system antidote protein VapI
LEEIEMKKKSTIYDVAKIAGVSPSTISRVMNTPEIVAEDTRHSSENYKCGKRIDLYS